MLNILDYSEKDLILLGDLHGEFNHLKYAFKTNNANKPVEIDKGKNTSTRKRKRSNSYISNAVFVICGDCGFGFNKLPYYESILSKLQDELEKSNNILLFLRGNHDDPDYFQTVDGKFSFSNIKFIPDYSILKTRKYTSLCIGGAVSSDRGWRLKENLRLNKYRKNNSKVIYWKNECVIEPSDSFYNDFKESGMKVDSIITHTIPLHILQEDKKLYKSLTETSWHIQDSTLLSEQEKEGQILTNVIDTLTNLGNKFDWWVCGHIHEGNYYFLSNGTFVLVLPPVGNGRGYTLDHVFKGLNSYMIGMIEVSSITNITSNNLRKNISEPEISLESVNVPMDYIGEYDFN